MRKTATTSGAFWTRSHHLDRMTFRELVVAYFRHYAIVTYLALTGAAIGLFVLHPATAPQTALASGTPVSPLAEATRPSQRRR